MNLEDLSIRPGMQHGLYIGICIGVILTVKTYKSPCTCTLTGWISVG
ncbi:MAG: hypothetical protein GX268_09220 [Methanomicrobiales archaeon]|nr:hypothetical protein [Methanomicrobiales archaeon]